MEDMMRHHTGRECQTEGSTAKTDVAKHSGGQATCQQKAECEVC